MSRTKLTAYAGPLAAVLSTILWGGAYVAMKFALRSFHPMTMIFLLLVVSSIAFLLIFPRMLKRQKYAAGDWRIFLILVICEPCLYFIFEGYALSFTSASQAGMLSATLPIFVGVFGYFLLKEKLSATAWAGCLIAICGAVWLSLGAVAGEHAPNPLLGNTLLISGMVVSALYAICVRRLSRGYTPMFITAVQAWVGLLFFAPTLFIPGMGLPEGGGTLLSWLSVVYLGLGVSFGAYSLYGFSISRMPAAKASMFMNLVPVFTILFGMVLLGERLTAVECMASALVLGGVIVSQMEIKMPSGLRRGGRRRDVKAL
ncbi:MAG: DMT family transporter [Desulfovibrio sp.]|jgi:drug/metabolite transporter (DMT)-like permease|nr:DMT family transporter [Desulfovibrio sp.]